MAKEFKISRWMSKDLNNTWADFGRQVSINANTGNILKRLSTGWMWSMVWVHGFCGSRLCGIHIDALCAARVCVCECPRIVCFFFLLYLYFLSRFSLHYYQIWSERASPRSSSNSDSSSSNYNTTERYSV